MKTIVVLIVSSIFLSTMSNNVENDSIEKVMNGEIENILVETQEEMTKTLKNQ